MSAFVVTCFACDRPLGLAPALVTCLDDQTAYVGRTCFVKIEAAGTAGYQPPKGGPRLFTFEAKRALSPPPGKGDE